MLRLIAITLFCLLCVSANDDAYAGRPMHGGSGSPPATCPQGGGANDNGCAAANQSATFINPTAFAYGMQTGQAAYYNSSGVISAHPTPLNEPGVDYPVGFYTPQASLLDPVANAASLGCSVPDGVEIRCNGNVDIEGYYFNGRGIYGGGGSTWVLKNNHFTMTSNDCRAFRGLGIVYMHAGSPAFDVENNTFDFDNTCSMSAFLWGHGVLQPPELVQNSTGTASLATNGTLTYSSTPTGSLLPGQFISYSGMVGSYMVLTYDGNVTATVCFNPSDYTSPTGGSCGTPTAFSSLTVTTGPVQANITEAVGAGASIVAKYNAILGYYEFIGMSGVSGMVADYNYENIRSFPGNHVNFVVSLPTPGVPATIPVYEQNGNFLIWDQYASFQTGTGTIDEFSTSSAANTATGGYEVSTTLFEAKRNVILTNTTCVASCGATTAAAFRYLTQVGTPVGTVQYTMNNGLLTVTAASTTIATGQNFACRTSGCTLPLVVTGVGGTCGPSHVTCTGTGGTGTYPTSSTDTVALGATQNCGLPGTGCNIFLWPGDIGTVDWEQNYIDPTGIINGAPFSADSEVPVVTSIQTNNLNLLTGVNF